MAPPKGYKKPKRTPEEMIEYHLNKQKEIERKENKKREVDRRQRLLFEQYEEKKRRLADIELKRCADMFGTDLDSYKAHVTGQIAWYQLPRFNKVPYDVLEVPSWLEDEYMAYKKKILVEDEISSMEGEEDGEDENGWWRLEDEF